METLDQDFIRGDEGADTNFGYNLAPLGKRFLAALIDGLIHFTIFLLIILLIGRSVRVVLTSGSWDFLEFGIRYASGIILAAIFYPMFSGNLGHKILNIKVISSIDGSDYNTTTNGFSREFLKTVLGFFLIPSIWLLWDKKYQNLYDKITNTLVVETKS